jgi:hypothetical protein
MSSTRNTFKHIYTDTSGKQWQEINLQVLALQNSFLSINA